MPFEKGNAHAGNRLGKRKDPRKTVWILESLQEHGYDYEKMLVQFLERAAHGDKMAYDMAALLVKLVPHLANAPKNDVGVLAIDTLVINRQPLPAPAVDTTSREANDPLQTPEP